VQFFATTARLVLSHRLVAAVLLLARGLASLPGLAQVRFDFSWLTFFSGDAPELARYQAFQDVWGHDDSVALAVVDGHGESLLTLPRLRQIQQLVDLLRRDADVARVDAVTSIPILWQSDAPVLELRPLADLLDGLEQPGSAVALDWRARLLADPALVPTLLSADGRYAAIAIELEASSDRFSEVAPALERVQATLDAHAKGSDLGVQLTGIPVFRNAGLQSMISDQLLLVPLALIVILGVFIAAFRRLVDVMVPLLAACLPTVMLFGLLGYADEPIGILNQAYFTLIPIIATADAVHFVTRFRSRRQLLPEGGGREAVAEAVVHVLSRVGVACLVTSLTTGIGFLSLGSAQLPVVRSFGVFAAIGLAFAFVVLVLGVPLLFSFSRAAVGRGERSTQPSVVDRLLDRTAALALGRPLLILAMTAALVLLAAAGSTRVVHGSKLARLLLPEHPAGRAGQIVDQHLGGLLNIQLDLRGAAGVMARPEVMTALFELEQKLVALSEVHFVVSPATAIAAGNQAITGQRSIPDSRAGVAQLLLLLDGDRRLDQLLDAERSRARMILRLSDNRGPPIIELERRLRKLLDHELAGLELSADVTGTALAAAHGVGGVTRDFRTSLIIAFAVISLVLGVVLRSLRLLLLCLVPNVLPILFGYGLLGWVGWNLDPMSAMVFVVALGIAVDDTVHLVVCFKQERERGADVDESIRRAVAHTGRAVLLTTLILILGFTINGLSSFPGLVTVARLGVAILAMACLCDLLVLPALLRLFARRSA